MGINAKCLYEGVIVPTALHRADAWGIRSAERMKVNILEMKRLRSLVRVSRMDRAINEEVHRSAGIKRELASGGSASFKMVWTRGENGRVPYV